MQKRTCDNTSQSTVGLHCRVAKWPLPKQSLPEFQTPGHVKRRLVVCGPIWTYLIINKQRRFEVNLESNLWLTRIFDEDRKANIEPTPWDSFAQD